MDETPKLKLTNEQVQHFMELEHVEKISRLSNYSLDDPLKDFIEQGEKEQDHE